MRRLTPELIGLCVAARRVGIALGCIVLPAVLLVTFFSVAFVTPPGNRINDPAFGWDFRATWRAAGDVVAGESPYAPPTPSALDGEDQFVYPPAPAFAAIPFRLLPFELAAVAFGILLVASMLLALRALGVRDWRCYGLVFAWVPVLESVRLGAVSVLLALGVALAWRYRDRKYTAAIAVGALIAAKLFLWPLVLWLALTGRLRKAAASVAVAVGATVAAWAAIGFAGLRDYPAMLDTLTDLVAWKSYSLGAFSAALGLPELPERLIPVMVGGALLLALAVFGRSRIVDGDERALVAAVAAALALSPIVWTHYFALLVVPIALARPRLGPLWLLPLLFWLSPNQSDGELWRISASVAIAGAVFAVALGARSPLVIRLRRGVALQPAGEA